MQLQVIGTGLHNPNGTTALSQWWWGVTIYQSTAQVDARKRFGGQFVVFFMQGSRFPTGSTASGAGDQKVLLDQVLRKDPAALKAIYDRCADRAMALALRILRVRSDAEEVLQETFLEVWRRTGEYDPRRGGVEGWVLTIARSRAIDRLRSQGAAAKYQAMAPISDPTPGLAVVAPDAVQQRQDRDRVEAALKALPPEQRQVVEMAYFDGLSQREIAGRTGDPLGTVKTRVRLGMEKLSHLLRDEGLRPT